MSTETDSDLPLCVDLDGTLVRSKSHLKHEIASRIDLADSTFPLNDDVVEYVKAEKTKRKTILVTGSHQRYADSISARLGIFDEAQGSSEKVNLTNKNKRDWLVDQFGENGFGYIGNDNDDLNVWPSARNALVVSEVDGIADKSDQTFAKVFRSESASTRDFFKLIRIHQWSKNFLIFVPFVLDQRFGDWPAVISVFIAFFAMCFLASLTYIFNDMLDLQADRLNDTKSKRALASGKIKLLTGFKTMLVLGGLLIVAMLNLPKEFNLILIAYLIITLYYSFYLKRFAFLDVSTIAALHTIRVVAGTVAISAEWSFWLLAFSMFIFFGLAIAKRVSELKNLEIDGRNETIGRDYRVTDIPVLMACGVAAGYISILIVALYINSEKVLRMYSSPEILWLLCPILMYWVGRLWLVTWRGQLHEDPVIFAMRDRVSQITFGLMGWTVALAIII